MELTQTLLIVSLIFLMAIGMVLQEIFEKKKEDDQEQKDSISQE